MIIVKIVRLYPLGYVAKAQYREKGRVTWKKHNNIKHLEAIGVFKVKPVRFAPRCTTSLRPQHWERRSVIWQIGEAVSIDERELHTDSFRSDWPASAHQLLQFNDALQISASLPSLQTRSATALHTHAIVPNNRGA